jgi:hypothetical protein
VIQQQGLSLARSHLVELENAAPDSFAATATLAIVLWEQRMVAPVRCSEAVWLGLGVSVSRTDVD